MIATKPICGQTVPLNQPRRLVAEMQVVRHGRGRNLRGTVQQQRQRAPDQERDHHHGGDLHDPQRLAARFVHALDVAPPEVER